MKTAIVSRGTHCPVLPHTIAQIVPLRSAAELHESSRNHCRTRYLVLLRWLTGCRHSAVREDAARCQLQSSTAPGPRAGVTLKCFPREKKSARGKIITELICLPLLKYRRPRKKSFHYRIALLKKSPPADNLRAKIRPDRRALGFKPVICRPGETFPGAIL